MRGRGMCLLIGMKAGQAQAQKQVAMQQQQQAAQQQAYEKGKQEGMQGLAAPSVGAPAPTTAGLQSSQSAAPSADNITAQLQNLAKMHNAGILTDEEFAAAKKKLLG